MVDVSYFFILKIWEKDPICVLNALFINWERAREEINERFGSHDETSGHDSFREGATFFFWELWFEILRILNQSSAYIIFKDKSIEWIVRWLFSSGNLGIQNLLQSRYYNRILLCDIPGSFDDGEWFSGYRKRRRKWLLPESEVACLIMNQTLYSIKHYNSFLKSYFSLCNVCVREKNVQERSNHHHNNYNHCE